MTKTPLVLPEGLRHIAVIMDGNGRWAKQKNKSRTFGHRQGSKSVKALVELCAKSGLEYLSLFAFSTENWNRPKEEVENLMDLFCEFLSQQSSNIIKNNVIFKISGEVERLPEKVIKLANELILKTSNNSGMTLNLAVSYGGRQDIMQAFKKIMQDGIKPELVNEELVNKYLWTAGMPDPDLLIRTSGEFRISNFMIWQTAYTEIYITEVLWPDFDEAELAKAVNVFAGRKRRFGKVL